MTRTDDHDEAQGTVIARLSTSRAELIAANQKLRLTGISPTPVTSDLVPFILRTPNAALIAALVVGAVVIGPRRLLGTTLRTALSAWISRTVGTIASRKVTEWT
jgi:hypothetical protein